MAPRLLCSTCSRAAIAQSPTLSSLIPLSEAVGVSPSRAAISTISLRTPSLPLPSQCSPRSFSTTPTLDRRLPATITKRRRAMFTWFDRMWHLRDLPDRMELQRQNPTMFKLYDDNIRAQEEEEEEEGDRVREEEAVDEDEDDEGNEGRESGRKQVVDTSRGSIPRADELIKAPQYATLSQQEPFMLNTQFHSEPVLSDGARELIWSDITNKGDPIKIVSARYGVDIRRVAAVVRLKQAEKNWIKANKKLPMDYARAVLSVLPNHNLPSSAPFESVSDVPVHRYTMQQLFWPVAESKRFTRADAAKAFNRILLPADKRVPIPEWVDFAKDKLKNEGIDPPEQILGRFRDAVVKHERKIEARRRAKAEKEAARITKVESDRFQFRFQNFQVEDVGRDGRNKKGTGWRYGVPLYDRQRGHSLEVPTTIGL